MCACACLCACACASPKAPSPGFRSSFVVGGRCWLLSYPSKQQEMGQFHQRGFMEQLEHKIKVGERDRGAGRPVRQSPAGACINRKHFRLPRLPKSHGKKSPFMSPVLRPGLQPLPRSGVPLTGKVNLCPGNTSSYQAILGCPGCTGGT